MAATHYIANLTDDKGNTIATAKRSTQGRTYTHMVFVRRTVAKVIADAKANVKLAQDNAAYYAEKIAMGGDERVETLINYKGEPVEHKRGAALAYYEAGAKRNAAWQAEQEAIIANAQIGEWRDGGWASRQDLAVKNASQWSRKGYEVEIVHAEQVDAKTHKATSAVENA